MAHNMDYRSPAEFTLVLTLSKTRSCPPRPHPPPCRQAEQGNIAAPHLHLPGLLSIPTTNTPVAPCPCHPHPHLAGKLNRETLLPLICTYLASIPATNIPPPRLPAEVTPLAVTYPEAPVVEDVQV